MTIQEFAAGGKVASEHLQEDRVLAFYNRTQFSERSAM